MNRKEDFVRKEYVGKYVVIHTQTKLFSGRLDEILEDFFILNPHQGYNYINEDEYQSVIVNEPAMIRAMDIIGIIPMSKESLENYCKYSNKHEASDRKNKKITE